VLSLRLLLHGLRGRASYEQEEIIGLGHFAFPLAFLSICFLVWVDGPSLRPPAAVLVSLTICLQNATVASAFIEGALYGQASFLVPAAAAVAGNTSVFRELAQDQNLILQISSLKLTPSYREELDLLDNSTGINLGKSNNYGWETRN